MVMALAGNPTVPVVGAVLNCLGTGILLPSLLTLVFGGEFVCPLVLLALDGLVGSLAAAVGVLGLTSAAVGGALLLSIRRGAAALAGSVPQK
ncbi:hypothetical protein [Streptomyces sp. CB03234]|uniref:hypothetical protein n=1 Tax=Streptomyces sp. (strain CB03234) TaxID=1703937 RepID=UPI0018E9A460